MGSKFLTPTTDPATVVVSALPSAAASGLPPTRGNVTMLIDMEETFTSMFTALKGARSRVLICAWFLHIDTLINGGRNPPTLLDELRQLVKKGVEIKLLLSFLEGKAFPGARTAQQIRSALLQGLSKTQQRFLKVQIGFHPATLQGRRIGTYHEKLLLVDGAVAFCGGLEFNKEYARASPHRHDVHCRVEGPAVAMLERHFVARWNAAGKEAKAQKLNEDPLATLPAAAVPTQVTHAVQWVFTAGKDGPSSLDPFLKDVTEIFDSYVAAIDAAQNYIYIENQYFRSDDLTKRLVARLKKNQQLELVVLMPSAPEEDRKDPITRFAEWLSNEQIKLLNQQTSSEKSRVGFFSLCQGRNRFPYVHSKIMIVDDKWITVGSANANARSFFLDMEANLLIRDDNSARTLRARLWKEHLGSLNSQWSPGAGGALDLWMKAATRNAEAISHGKRCPCSIIEHKVDPKITRPSDKELQDKYQVPPALMRFVPEKLLRELVFEPEFDDTRMV